MEYVTLTEDLTLEEFNTLLAALQYAEANAVTPDESEKMRKLTDKVVEMSDGTQAAKPAE